MSHPYAQKEKLTLWCFYFVRVRALRRERFVLSLLPALTCHFLGYLEAFFPLSGFSRIAFIRQHYFSRCRSRFRPARSQNLNSEERKGAPLLISEAKPASRLIKTPECRSRSGGVTYAVVTAERLFSE